MTLDQRGQEEKKQILSVLVIASVRSVPLFIQCPSLPQLSLTSFNNGHIHFGLNCRLQAPRGTRDSKQATVGCFCCRYTTGRGLFLDNKG